MWLRPVRSPRWSVGVAWYGGDMLLWYRGLSLSVRPQERLSRAELRVESRRSPGRDDLALPSDVVVLTITTPEGPRELAFGRLDGDRLPLVGGVGATRLIQSVPAARWACAPLCAPGSHSTSPPGFAARARMKSRSESRLR